MRTKDKRLQGRRGKTAQPPRATIRLAIDRLAWGGRGVGRHEGKVVFVSKAVPGDQLEVSLTKDRGTFSEGRIAALLQAGTDRVDPRCPWFDRCGGCQWLAVRYDRQVQEKEALLRSSLRHHLEGAQLDPLARAEPALSYRHRGDFHPHVSAGGLRLGFHEEGSHRLVEVDACRLFAPAFDEVLATIRAVVFKDTAAANLERLTIAHSEGHKDGFVVLLRMRNASGGLALSDLLERLVGSGPLVGGVASFGGSTLAILGEPHLWFSVPDPSGDLRLRADIRSFTQAHLAMNRRLVQTAQTWLGQGPATRLLDLYAGVGNFTLPLSSHFEQVVAVEGNPVACKDARFNAASHGRSSIRHLEGDAAAEASRLADKGEAFDAVVLDPPRTGAKEVIPALARLCPTKVLYVSCNLPSLERDLGLLRLMGYRVTRVQGFDCFPQTYGLETLCLLERG